MLPAPPTGSCAHGPATTTGPGAQRLVTTAEGAAVLPPPLMPCMVLRLGRSTAGCQCISETDVAAPNMGPAGSGGGSGSSAAAHMAASCCQDCSKHIHIEV